MGEKRSFQIATAFGVALASYAWIMYYGQKKSIYVPPTSPNKKYNTTVIKNFYISGINRNNSEDGIDRQEILKCCCMEGDKIHLIQDPTVNRPGRIAVYLANGLHDSLKLGYLPQFAEKEISPFLNLGGDVRGYIKNIRPIANTNILGCEVELQLLYNTNVA